METQACFAPTFEPQNWLVCLLMILTLPAVALAFLIAFVIGLILEILLPGTIARIVCNFKKYTFRVQNCQKGNDNPNIRL